MPGRQGYLIAGHHLNHYAAIHAIGCKRPAIRDIQRNNRSCIKSSIGQEIRKDKVVGVGACQGTVSHCHGHSHHVTRINKTGRH